MDHRIALNRCCCPENVECVVYLPCCIRDLRFQMTVNVVRLGLDDYCYIKNFTVENHCNEQKSPDWSDWRQMGSTTGGTVEAIGGYSGQGCTYSIDIDKTHIFCPCGSKNFTVEFTICNPHDDDITVTLSSLSFAAGFEIITQVFPCAILDQQTSTPAPFVIAANDEHTVTLEYGPTDFGNCKQKCIENRAPDTIVEDENYLNDNFDTTCIEPVYCIPEDTDNLQADTNKGLVDCTDLICPPCGCNLDYLYGNLTPPYFVSSSVASGTGPVGITLPAGVQEDDLLLLYINGAGEDDLPDNAPARWEPISQPNTHSEESGTDGAASRVRLTVYWNRYDPLNPPVLTIPDAGDHTLAVIVAVRNVKVAGNPFAKIFASSDSTADTSVVVDGLTTEYGECFVLAAASAGAAVTTGSWVNASLSGFAEIVDESTASGNDGAIAIAAGVKSIAGVVSATTATFSGSAEEANFCIALRPHERVLEHTGGCACGCGSKEAKNACEWPKELIPGNFANSGEMGLCESYDDGFAALDWVVVFFDGCAFLGGIYRDLTFSPPRWRYVRWGVYDPAGPVGPLFVSRDVTIESEIDCEFFNIEWQWTGSDLEICINGTCETSTPADWTPTGNPAATAVAQVNSVWTKQD